MGNNAFASEIGVGMEALRNPCSLERLSAKEKCQVLLSATRLKETWLRREVADGSVAAIDEILCLDALSPSKLGGEIAWDPKMAAMLPAKSLLDLGSWRPEALGSGRGAASAAHWIVEAASKRAMFPPRQEDLFPGESALFRLRESLRAACGIRGDLANSRDQDGATPLHWAVYLLALECVEDLLEAGSNPEAKNAEGIAAFDPDAFRGFHAGMPKIEPAAARCSRMQATMEAWALEKSAGQGSRQGEARGL